MPPLLLVIFFITKKGSHEIPNKKSDAVADKEPDAVISKRTDVINNSNNYARYIHLLYWHLLLQQV
jgi:hypothetical protein